MKKCPKCNSTDISKEYYKNIVPNAYAIGGSSANNETGDLVCDKCNFTSSPNDFN